VKNAGDSTPHKQQFFTFSFQIFVSSYILSAKEVIPAPPTAGFCGTESR
jgi:hypothetical protein